MKDYVVIIRLTSGEDIIAILIDDSESYIEVEHPFIIAYNPNTGTAILKPYQLWTDDHNFIFNNSSVISVSSSNENIYNYYIEVMNSYSKIISKKPSVDDLLDLLDPNLSTNTDDLLDNDNIKIEGNITKH